MEEIKSKLIGLIHKQKKHVKIPEMGFSEFPRNQILVSDSLIDDSKIVEEPELFDNIEELENFYYGDSFDVAAYVIKKLTRSNITCVSIESYMNFLLKQKKNISKKVLENILGQKNSCYNEIENINGTEQKLQEAFWVCKKSRSFLLFARNNLTSKSLKILAAYRKKEILSQLLESINIIKIMKSTEKEVQKLLSEGNYSLGIEILLKCKQSSSKYCEYACVNSLHVKVKETILITEYQLDTILKEMTHRVHIHNYEELQKAYKHLNKSIAVMDQVHINFIAAIHGTFNNILGSYCNISSEDKLKLLFEELCANVPSERYITCFTDLCRSIWNILISYHHIVTWHQNYKLYPDDLSCNSPDIYIGEKLKIGKVRIWNDIQSKMCTYLSTASERRFKYEQYIQIISIVQKLRKVGIEFCGNNSIKLMETMHLQSLDFFHRYHITCLEEICLFVDNESWGYVSSLTNILQLEDFRNLKISIHHKPLVNVKTAVVEELGVRNENVNDFTSLNSQDENSLIGTNAYFVRYVEKSSPFDVGLDASMLEEDILSGIADDLLHNFAADGDDEESALNNTVESNNKSKYINATCLNILRCIGRYLQMCKLLHFISTNIISAMWELVGFYAYAVYTIFASAPLVEPLNFNSTNIEAALKKIEKDVIPKILIWPLNFSSLTSNELSKSETIYGLPYRIQAVESGISLVTQLKLLSPYLKNLLPTSEFHLLDLNSSYIDIFNQLSLPVYICSTSKLIDLKSTLNNMSKVKWDVNHVSVQHSSYIDLINRNIQTFAMSLDELSKNLEMPLKPIWESLIHVLTHLLVEGYSNTKNCSPAGRALMQLDFTHFISIFELISGEKFPTYCSYVDTFVKAYYYPPDVFTEWILRERNFKTYTKKQLSNLITCVFSSDRRTKQKLLEIVESNPDSSL